MTKMTNAKAIDHLLKIKRSIVCNALLAVLFLTGCSSATPYCKPRIVTTIHEDRKPDHALIGECGLEFKGKDLLK